MKDTITICGNSKSGKDTVAEYIAKKHGYTTLALANPIKKFLKDLFEFDDNQLYGPGIYRDMPDARFHDYDCRAWLDVLKKCFGRNSLLQTFVERLSNITELSFDRNDVVNELAAIILSLREQHTALSPRVALQEVGTSWGRDKVNQNLWVIYAQKTIKLSRKNCIVINNSNGTSNGKFVSSFISLNKKFIITDIRFRNEFDAFNASNAFSIKVKRPNLEIMDHTSETELLTFPDDIFSAIIDNNGSLEDLYAKVDKMLDG